ncbi:MAG TPA: UTP--glucose-1-phosphate uridylyltransferase [Candidatus Sulfopaludibacter sp.]|nr:UTP--glucose-1-phosphate uridylyltransferase [Candidatus Sulfopaludibacter sp.]
MSRLTDIIDSTDPQLRNQSLDAVCEGCDLAQLMEECDALERYRREQQSLYKRVRALFFLYAIHRFHIPLRAPASGRGLIPYEGYEQLLKRRFEEAIAIFRAHAKVAPGAEISSALASGYHSLGFQTLADQVRLSVRSVRGNQWMFRCAHTQDYPLRLKPELLQRNPVFPILRETTPVRMDLTHSGWSDIFFLGMDYPEGARVLNISVDLAVAGDPVPPVEAYLRVVDQPVLRLTSVDLQATTDISTFAEVFDFARDYLGLLKAAVIASGLVPPGMETSTEPVANLMARLTGMPGLGLELVSKVNDIPKGSRLAVSTTLLASLISACMRATDQIHALSGSLQEGDRRLLAARAILGEWLGGSGGGWQDSGGVWPGIKLIHGVPAQEGDPEFGVSRGRLLPDHQIFGADEVTPATREKLQHSLVLVHGGMAQDVGPILEMVTEKYLLRSGAEWEARNQAIGLLDQVVDHLRSGDIRGVGDCTQRNFDGPIQTIIPWAGNLYTRSLIERVRAAMGESFWGFWMLGGMSGGGMGFLFDPARRDEGEQQLRSILAATKRELETAVPFAMEPVVYRFAINERGSHAELLHGDAALLPAQYYALTVPLLVRTETRTLSAARQVELSRFAAACRDLPEFAGVTAQLFEQLLPKPPEAGDAGKQSLGALLETLGFDPLQHQQIQAAMRAGRIGLRQNRLSPETRIDDVRDADFQDAREGLDARYRSTGLEAMRQGMVAVVTLAGGVGSRWTKGAGVVKALNPFCKLNGKYRSFIEVHLSKSRRAGEQCGTLPPHVFTTSYLTHRALQDYLAAQANCGYPGPLKLSEGRAIGLRLIPTERDLRFAWEEMPRQLLDEQAQKVRQGLHAALIGWAREKGEAANYEDNLPLQCLHPVGHWYEVPNLLRNGTLQELLQLRPHLKYLMVHNVDTMGVNVDPALLGYHMESGAGMTTEVIARHLEDRGGGLARVDDRPRLVEGLALPAEEIESRLSFYNSATYWVDIDQLLALFRLTRADLADEEKLSEAVRRVAVRMPAYITLKDVKKRWGKGQEDVYPVAQFEKLWGDMTALTEWNCNFVAVSRRRGQQMKEPAQLDGWLRDGSAAYIESLM